VMGKHLIILIWFSCCKISPRFPDFKHKKPWEGLWLGDQ
jgi:hypothetical protein